jgi:glutamate decarboxylase
MQGSFPLPWRRQDVPTQRTFYVLMNLDYVCLSEIHHERPGYENLHEDDPERYEPGLPVVSFRLTDEFKEKHPHIHQVAVSTLLRVKGWIVPNYPLPPNEEKTEILRVVVRESFSSSMYPFSTLLALQSYVGEFG